MKLRFGWGPVDGAEGMQRNLDLVRTVREAVGDGVDVMADAYMGWTLDYAKRMLPLLEPFNLRWLEEAVIPDDIHGYAELKSYGRVPIAGGEHEFTLHGSATCSRRARVDYIQFDTNRVGGITQARKIAALAEAHSGARHPARRPDAQLSRRHGQPELADGGVLPASSTSRSATSCSGTSSTASRRRSTATSISTTRRPGSASPSTRGSSPSSRSPSDGGATAG